MIIKSNISVQALHLSSMSRFKAISCVLRILYERRDVNIKQQLWIAFVSDTLKCLLAFCFINVIIFTKQLKTDNFCDETVCSYKYIGDDGFLERHDRAIQFFL